MESSIQPQTSPGTLALGGARAIDLVDNGRGLVKLALMVGTIFERLTSVKDGPARAKSD